MEPEDETASAEPASRLADAVSIASDFGFVWVVVALAQIVTGRTSPLDATRRLAAAGVVSLALTRWLKHRYAVPRSEKPSTTMARTPTSDRFPSGHTLAAFTAALSVPSGRRGRAVALAFAVLVAWARVRVGHHRTVDVVAGAAVGSLAGGVLSRVLPSTAT